MICNMCDVPLRRCEDLVCDKCRGKKPRSRELVGDGPPEAVRIIPAPKVLRYADQSDEGRYQ